MYTATVIAKQNDTGYSRIAIQYTDGVNTLIEWMDCDFPIKDGWIEKKCANRCQKLQDAQDSIEGIKLKKVGKAPADPIVVPAYDPKLDSFNAALDTLRRTKRGFDLGLFDQNRLNMAIIDTQRLYHEDYFSSI